MYIHIHTYICFYVVPGADERREAAQRSVKLQYPSVIESHF